MTQFICKTCEMKVDPLTCGTCHEELKVKTITKEGKTIQVCECPNGCGKIKSPVCCGQDMKAS